MTPIFLEDLVSFDKFKLICQEYDSEWAFAWALKDVGFSDQGASFILLEYNIDPNDKPEAVYDVLVAEAAMAEHRTTNK